MIERFISSEMLRHVKWQIVTEVSVCVAANLAARR